MRARPRTTPRKAPRQARSRATVDAILAATAQVLVRDGYDRTSTNKVAEVAGVSIGSLYQYYPSKEALVAALIERHMQRLAALLETKMIEVGEAPVPVAVRALLSALVDAKTLEPKLQKVLMEQVPRVGRLCKVAQMDKHFEDLLRGYLQMRHAQIRPTNLDAAVFLLVTTGAAVTHAIATDRPEHISVEELVDETAEMVMRYLRPDAPAHDRDEDDDELPARAPVTELHPLPS
ncbi:MAG TPA: TetR/AcrR family transcriptional regulator [Myxococcaceae bacterium]